VSCVANGTQDSQNLPASILPIALTLTGYLNYFASQNGIRNCTSGAIQVPLFGCATSDLCSQLSSVLPFGLVQNWENGCCNDSNCNSFSTGFLTTFIDPNSNINNNGNNNGGVVPGNNNQAGGNNNQTGGSIQCYQGTSDDGTSLTSCGPNSLCIQIPANSPCSLLRNGNLIPGFASGTPYYGCVPITTCLEFSKRATELPCAAIFDMCCAGSGCNVPQNLRDNDAPVLTTTRMDSSAMAFGASAIIVLLFLASLL